MSDDPTTRTAPPAGLTLTDASPFPHATHGTITFCSRAGIDMLRIEPDAFWVRGEKVPQDAGEALAVYNGFVKWMKEAGALR